ncbi:MAG: gamma-glutamyl-phosphate reductase, partial [Candidatus Competibacteraceae bacterium]|nr:gamma-glutamyl-phosphate reductase [Candidatus Competibacteraceae bacterium]
MNDMNQDMTSVIEAQMTAIGQRARAASRIVGCAETQAKDAALLAIAEALEAAETTLLTENRLDMEAGRAAGLEPALLDRLEITPKGVKAMAQGLREIAAQTDPVGEITDLKYRPSGIQVGRMRVPLGVIGVIYESRPNVTA